MGNTVNDQAAGSAYPFPAIMIKGYGLFALSDKLFIHLVKHFQKGHIRTHIRGLNALHSALVPWAALPPYIECEIHYL
jgi:hypothetical protein